MHAPHIAPISKCKCKYSVSERRGEEVDEDRWLFECVVCLCVFVGLLDHSADYKGEERERDGGRGWLFAKTLTDGWLAGYILAAMCLCRR